MNKADRLALIATKEIETAGRLKAVQLSLAFPLDVRHIVEKAIETGFAQGALYAIENLQQWKERAADAN